MSENIPIMENKLIECMSHTQPIKGQMYLQSVPKKVEPSLDNKVQDLVEGTTDGNEDIDEKNEVWEKSTDEEADLNENNQPSQNPFVYQ